MNASLPPGLAASQDMYNNALNQAALQSGYAAQNNPYASQLGNQLVEQQAAMHGAWIKEQMAEINRDYHRQTMRNIGAKTDFATWNFFMKKISRFRVRMCLLGTYILAGSAVALGLSVLCAAWRFFFWSIIQ